MKKTFALAAALAFAGALPLQAASTDGKVRIGLLYTLSGPAAVLGEQSRDGFLMAAEKLGNRFGGLEAEIIVIDDEQKPDVAVARAREMVERDQVDFVVGPIFSNVLYAILQPVTQGGAIMVSTNAGTSSLAGTECNPDLFVTSYQNDQIHEVSGKYAQDQGYGNVVLITPNYQAGKDAMAGFKHSYGGNVASELFVPLGQLDFSAELAQIAAFQPDAVYAFMPGGMGVNFVKQYRQAGLDSIPFLSAFTVDESTLPAQGADALDFLAGSNWAPDLDTPQTAEFTDAFIARYDRVPATFAMQAYDAAMLIDSAIRITGGKLDDREALRAAMKQADFTSLRGDFRFGDNHFPIQDFYLTKVVRREDGRFATSIVQTIFEDYQDNFASSCRM
ncbi:ABC transporter substrate-binding protein [Paracoccus sp. YIM 132242]|uniref:ABC transporter substrate-binding protein n=1 Tax=Paracoccus lichenicola TaxID=2665644 RepID=A0A6L6HTN0_9RHOB|nr:ABC transporter substrate-binding protein [Paracoccus lichenicola]MTE01583.1 ABC transporter substrate-binding protein [Paracoccus lichenicola]